MNRRTSFLVVALVALVLIGCSDDGATGDAGAATSTSSTAPPTTAPADPFAIPAEIDVAYTETVATELYRVVGEATRTAVEAGEVNDDVEAKLHDVMVDPLARAFVANIADFAAIDFSTLHRPPGDPVVSVTSLRHGDEDCIAADATLDYGAMLVSPTDFGDLVMVLRRDPAPEETSHNRTPWELERSMPANEYDAEGNGCGRADG